jgi:hypothetical protein
MESSEGPPYRFMYSNELKEQEAHSKSDAARHGLEQPIARQPSPRR